MTKIKLCGLSRPEDIEAANELKPDYIGFVFAPGSKRCVTAAKARELKHLLHPSIRAVGVFVNEDMERIASIAESGIIDIIQLHGTEDGAYIERLCSRTDLPILHAFRVASSEDIDRAKESPADSVLLDAGAGTGMTFDWSFLKAMTRPYFLAGGLTTENAGTAVRALTPYAVDVSSGIETNGYKDKEKMAAFIAAVRNTGKEQKP